MKKQDKIMLLELSRKFEEGCKLFEAGEYLKSAEILEALIQHNPKEIGPYAVCAAAYAQIGQHEQADVMWDKAIEKEPENMGLHVRKIYGIFTAGKTGEAIETAEKALELHPGNRELIIAYGSIASKCGPKNYLKGALALEEFIEKEPENTEALNALGAILSVAGKYREAINYFIRVLRVEPNHAVALLNVAGAFEKIHQPEMALNFYESLLKIDPEQGLAQAAKASILCNLGLSEENEGLLKKGIDRLIEIKDVANYIIYSSNYIFYTHYVPNFPREKIRTAIDDWYKLTCERIIEKPRSDFENKVDEHKKLRIGMISNAFKRHPVTWMTIAAFENLNTDKFEVYIYSDILLTKRDDMTKRFYDACESVHEVNGLSNDELIKRLREDEIDILLELTGHSEGGRRLSVSAARVAPVQTKWVGGLFDTTGLPQMDWLLADDVQIPKGDEKWYSERIYRMPDDYIVYSPPSYVEDVQPLPALKNGYVTFGNLNNLCKTNTYTINLWSKILKAVPKSRLLMKVQNLDTPYAQKHIEEAFAKNGIGVDRLVLEGGEPHKNFMEAHSRCDIALDPHPYTGGLTTCEALWMGVPVVTLPGETFAGRHAATHLHNAGLPDWIAKDEQDYIDIAVKWANDLEGLAKLRAGLREQVANSPLTDGPKFAKNFEKALRFMWKDWCDEKIAYDKKNTKKKDKK